MRIPSAYLMVLLPALLAAGCTKTGTEPPEHEPVVDLPPSLQVESERLTFTASGEGMSFSESRRVDFTVTGFLAEFTVTGYWSGSLVVHLYDTTSSLVERITLAGDTSHTFRRETSVPIRTVSLTMLGFTGTVVLKASSRARVVLLSLSGFPIAPWHSWEYLLERSGQPPESVEVLTTPPSPTTGAASVWTVRRRTPEGPTVLCEFRIYAENLRVWFVPQDGSIQMHEPEPWLPYSRIAFPLQHGKHWKPLSITGLDAFGDADAALDEPHVFLGREYPDVFRVTNRVLLSTQSLLETTLWIVPGLGIVRIRASTDNPAHPVENWTLVRRRTPYQTRP